MFVAAMQVGIFLLWRAPPPPFFLSYTRFAFLIPSLVVLLTQNSHDEYQLVYPKCNDDLHGLWFLQGYGGGGEHGLYCCSGCIAWFVSKSGTTAKQWSRCYTRKEYCTYGPSQIWEESKRRTDEFLSAIENGGAAGGLAAGGADAGGEEDDGEEDEGEEDK